MICHPNKGLGLTSLIKVIILVLFLTGIHSVSGQTENNEKKLDFYGDFRFRSELDWNNINQSGDLIDDRFRFRYRARAGFTYQLKDWVGFGAKIRTGEPDKQQDPNLTLGAVYKEFGGLPIGFATAYIEFKHKWLRAWLGKNNFPFLKQNELFWSDAVYPEGIAAIGAFNFKNNIIEQLRVSAGHFIVESNGGSFKDDATLQGIQLASTHLSGKLIIMPTFFQFNELPEIPDQDGGFTLDYSIIQLGAKAKILSNPDLVFGMDFYENLQDYSDDEMISDKFKDQTTGLVSYLSLGDLKTKGHYIFSITFTYLERYSAVDYFAQNDWTRWSYSAQGSKDGRLTNYRGVQLGAGYALNENLNLQVKCYLVEQLIPLGESKESGNRIRFDLNISL
ncbi:MAG: putative porin [Bacteroidia bacterium]|nr:putative porin [Bacteroidia bacterium]